MNNKLLKLMYKFNIVLFLISLLNLGICVFITKDVFFVLLNIFNLYMGITTHYNLKERIKNDN